MNAYAYKAALYCEDCGKAIAAKLDRCGFTLDETFRADSERYPQGPLPFGGGEADCPQHCVKCGVFLENSLTTDGRAYVHEAIDRAKEVHTAKIAAGKLAVKVVWNNPTVRAWAEYYGMA